MHRVFIGIGSNLGLRRANLEAAARRLEAAGVAVTALSSILETVPVDYLRQGDFLNQMALVETNLAPEELLEKLKVIETEMGRQKTLPKGPRLIDLDIILYDDLICSGDELTIPHPERLNRFFIIQHLAELDPELRDPVTGELYWEIKCSYSSTQRHT
jgi:2-amino-4-hydroxy-6-hydroxymethyldihydropteridine diphosphokinase